MPRGVVRQLPLSLAVILAAAHIVANVGCGPADASENSDAGGNPGDGSDGGDGGADGGDDGATDDGSGGGDGGSADPQDVVTIALAGDAMLGRHISDLLGQDPPFEIWRGLDPWLADVDVLAINLETTITTLDDPWPDKAYNFKLNPDHASAALDSLPLLPGARRFAAVANNHALDFGVEGMLDTIQNLDDLGFAHAGVGDDLDSASSPAIIETESGVRIGFLSASTHCSCNDADAWTAAASKAGMWFVEGDGGDWSAAIAAVETLEPNVDVVVFSIHWGPNFHDDPPPAWMRDMGRALVDAGADIVHGHSAHQVTPIESVEGKTVVYGPGDLIDDYAPVEPYRNDLSFLTLIRVQDDGAQRFEIVPLKIHHGGGHFVQPLDPDDPDYALVYDDAGL